jgi:hypothetical protein
MADFTFERGNVNAITLTVLRLSGTIPTYPTDYTNPELRISHINGNNEIEDLAFVAMTQVSGSSRWYYKYTIPLTAAFTRYLVTFRTTIESVLTLATEEFKVNPPIGFAGGSGEFPVEVEVTNSETLQPISGAMVTIRDYLNPCSPLAMVVTDSAGKATVFLNVGNYSTEFEKTGVISEVHKLVVNSDGTYNFEGD